MALGDTKGLGMPCSLVQHTSVCLSQDLLALDQHSCVCWCWCCFGVCFFGCWCCWCYYLRLWLNWFVVVVSSGRELRIAHQQMERSPAVFAVVFASAFAFEKHLGLVVVAAAVGVPGHYCCLSLTSVAAVSSCLQLAFWKKQI